MLVDKDDLGSGKHSWGYSMLVKDGVIKKMFIFVCGIILSSSGLIFLI